MSERHIFSETKRRRLRSYPKYKDSGVEWLGEIPKTWSYKRLRYACETITDGSHQSPQTVIDGLPYVTVRDLTNSRVNVEKASRISEADFRELERNGCRPKKGDVLFSKDGTIGKVALVDSDDFVVLSSLAILRPAFALDSAFLSYFLASIPGISQIESKFAGAALRRITLNVIVDLITPMPRLEDQRAIATFLDRETSKIDALAAKKERLIELLREKRTALITQAVTKGLDPNVPMKDSGVEWLGEVPAHWEVLRLKYLLRARKGAIKTGPFGSQLQSSEMIAGEIKVYNQRSVLDHDFSAGENYISLHKFTELRSFEAFPGDLLITTRGTIGKCAVLPAKSERGILHSCLMRVQVDQVHALNRYLEILIQDSGMVLKQLQLMSNATTIDVIYSDSLKEVWNTIPPVYEQCEIADVLDRETAKIDMLIAKIQEAIDRLKEYRTALISAAVTGKIDIQHEGK